MTIDVEAPPSPAREPGQLPTADLIAHILERYHERHRQEFPEAIALARKVEAVHAGDPQRPSGLADHLAFMADDLEGHQRNEEMVLFPLLLAGGGAVARFPIQRMRAEHVDVEAQLDKLAVLTTGFRPPAHACRTWKLLYAACKTLDNDLREHMRLENERLFPRFADPDEG